MKIGKRSLPIGTLVLGFLVLVFIGVAIFRYWKGLGAASNMSDGRGWGIWIGFDLYCGVALAAGGFTLAAIVYIFNLEKYHPVVRPAILTAFLGYMLVAFALLIDLGQPWYIWHAVIYWNIHSPLFEVAWCVMTYLAVLALEFSPAVFEKLHWNVPLKYIRMIQIPLVIAGIVISTGHQSSLGSMLLMTPDKLSPLWYTPILNVLFLVSAISVGLAMVIVESSLSGKALGHKVDVSLLGGLAKAIPYILGFYLILKLGALLAAGNLGLIFTEYPENLYWWLEVIVGVVVPVVLFTRSSMRQSRTWLFVGAGSVVLGLVINRFNVTMLAMRMRPDTSYFPSWMEFAVSIGLVAGGVLVYMLANRFLPVVEHHEVHDEVQQEVHHEEAQETA